MKEETIAALKLVTKELAEADATEKKAKTKKEAARKKFMNLCTLAVTEDRPLRKQSVEVAWEDALTEEDATDEELLERWRLKNYPAWRIISTEDSADRASFLVTIEEDPEFVKFQFVNEDLKKVFGRTVESRGDEFDSEGLREFVAFFDSYADEDDEDIYDALAKAWTERTVYDFNELHAQLVLSLHPQLMPLFQKYSIPGKLSAKLTPIRIAKEEEVE